MEHGVPLDAGGEGRPATAAQARVGDFLDNGGAIQGDGLLQALEATVGLVILQGQRAGDAHAAEGQALLASQEGDVLGEAVSQAVHAAGVKAGIEQLRHVSRRHRPVGQTAGGGFHLHQRFQPVQSAGAVADQLDMDASGGGFVGNGRSDLFSPNRQGAGIHRDVDTDAARGADALRRLPL